MKKFHARFSRLNDHRRRLLKEAPGVAIVHDELLAVLEDYLNLTLRRRDTRYPLFRAQMSMLVELINFEGVASEYKKQIQSFKDRLSDAPSDSAAQEELESLQIEHSGHRGLCRGIRDIGDGIAWRILGYDRAVLNILAERARKQHINPEGLEAELSEFAHAFHSDSVAVLNDLTHFLKRGDLLIKKSPDHFELVEVKASNTRSGTITRQRQDLQSAVTFLSNGVREDDQGSVTLVELPLAPENYVASIERLLKQAAVDGIAEAQVAEHLLVRCLDFRAMVNKESLEEAFEKTSPILARWKAAKDFSLLFCSLDRYAEVRHHAPWSIFPLSERDRVRLAVGAVELHSFCNLSEVLRYLERQEWRVTRGIDETAALIHASREEHGIILKKGPLVVELPFPLVARLASEFLRPRSILAALNALLAAGSRAHGSQLLSFSGEGQQWD